jgi:hypothetical protein
MPNCHNYVRKITPLMGAYHRGCCLNMTQFLKKCHILVQYSQNNYDYYV